MKRRLAPLTVALLAVLPALPPALIGACAAPVAAQAPPEARRGSHVDLYHGTRVEDPYRWMEDLESEELGAWMRAQDEYRARFFEDEARVTKRIHERLNAISSFRSQGVPVRKGDHMFFVRREVGERYNTMFVRDRDGADERALLDLEEFAQEGLSVFINSFSPDGHYLTYTTAPNQSTWRTAHILRVADGELLPEALIGFAGSSSNIAWTVDGAGFFYSRYDVPDDPQAPLGIPEIYHHVPGTDQSQDVPVYRRPQDPHMSLNLRVSHDGRYLVISGSESGGTFNGLYDRLFYKDLWRDGSDVVELFEAIGSSHAFEGSQGDLFWIRTTLDAPQGRVVAVDVEQPDVRHWKEIIPESESAIRAVSEIGERLLVQYVHHAREIARIYDFEGRLQHEIDHLAPTMGGFADDPGSDETFYAAGAIVGRRTYRYDVSTGESSVYFQPELDLDLDDFETNQVFYESSDGTRVPMFLVHRRGLQLDGNNPVFLYAYGAWAWSAYPWQSHMYPWMEMGGVYAVPNIRGGGEYGEAWHVAGIGRNKQNGIDDFIAAAEWLIENDYTSPSKLVANGGSASGLLPAVAMNQRPGLFGAAVINFPALDKLRYTEFGSAKSWTPEFGDPADPDDFQTLVAYSPYHNLEEGECYPPTWIQVGEKDDLVTPMHGYKFLARLQATQGCENPTLLKIAWGAGHSYGATPDQARRTQAEELAFLVRVLGMEVGDVVGGW